MGKKNNLRVPLSILDLSPKSAGASRADALNNSLKLAQVADRYGYARYWMAEHHGSATFMSCATSVLLARAAERTRRIRIGAGGVMLPNHVPLMVAEHYGTLATLYPGRIDLGLGRAPGTDPVTARALRRGSADVRDYASDIIEIINYLRPPAVVGEAQLSGAEAGAMGISYNPVQPVTQIKAIPGEGVDLPVWVLSSSMSGATVAAALGLPYSFAAHFASNEAKDVLSYYRKEFDANAETAQIKKPFVSGGVTMMCAPTKEEAEYLFSSTKLLSVNVNKGLVRELPEPVEDVDKLLDERDKNFLASKSGLVAVGDPGQVAQQLEDFVSEFGFDELVLVCNAHNPLARRRSYQLLAREWGIDDIFPEDW